MNAHVSQFWRGLCRASLLLLGLATLPLWLIPWIIYQLGDDSPCEYEGW